MDIHESLRKILDETEDPLAGRFYRVFFEQHPDLERHFEGVNLQFQGVMLTMALQLVAQYHQEPRPAIEHYLQLLGHKHYARNIPGDAYSKFQEALLTSLATFHAADWTPELAAEWREALNKGIQVMLQGHVPGAMSY